MLDDTLVLVRTMGRTPKLQGTARHWGRQQSLRRRYHRGKVVGHTDKIGDAP